jgi:hypothetical protein
MDMQTTFSQIYGVISQDIIMHCINLSRRMIYILIRDHWGQVQVWLERKPNSPRLTKIVGQETANYN